MSDIEGGIYIIRRDVIGIDNVIATGVGIEIPVLGLPLQESNPNVQRVWFSYTRDFVLRVKLIPQNDSGKCAVLTMILASSSNLVSFPAHLEVSG